ncbi:MAG: hypothetical protein JWN41_869 [Thermoleophilia bacterium]|nr:hypothetical protein [Thermoleophilia bacterium]
MIAVCQAGHVTDMTSNSHHSAGDRLAEKIVDKIPAARAFGGYDGLRESASALREGRSQAGGTTNFARDVARALPHVPLLLVGLVRDSKVPLRFRIGLAAAGGLAISPFDAIPDFIPVVGALDDAALVLLATRWALHSIDRAILRKHWKGSDAAFDALLRISGRTSSPA